MTRPVRTLCLFLIASLALQGGSAELMAQDIPLRDVNGDGLVSVLGFGDSLTYGVGDGEAPGAFIEVPPRTDGRSGYPARIESYVGVSVENRGVPGEELAEGGIARFPLAARNSSADVVVVFEGTNDTIKRLDSGEYARLLQKIVNVAKVIGKSPVLATLPQPCCDHQGREPFTASYSRVARDVAAINSIPIADLDRAWRTTCEDFGECELFNLPEGLHPNSLGYDVMAQTILATLYGVDVFALDGAVQLETATGLLPGTVIVKPGA